MRSQGRRIGCGDNREVDVLGNVVSDSVYAVDPSGAHRTRLGLTFPVNQVINHQRPSRRRKELALKGLEKTIAAGRLKDRNKMERRLGRIQARHPQVNDLYDVDLREAAEGVRLFWQTKEERKIWRESREGAYLLRTNLEAQTAEELWTKYMQLTEAEAAFRALKSELSIRPLFHQKEPRVKAHVMVAFLGYALRVTLKHWLQRRPAIVPKPSLSGVDNAQPLSPMNVLALLSNLHSADIVLPTTDGREIRLRRITEPDAEQKSLLHQLGLSLPDRLQFKQKCSADSASA